MAIDEGALRAALAQVMDEHRGEPLAAGRALAALRVQGGSVEGEVVVGYAAKSRHRGWADALEAAARAVPGVASAHFTVRTEIAAHAVQRGVALLPGVKNIVAVASGKGGVGKSTVCANLALAMAAEGASVGILDADIYGPSQPMMLGLEGRPESTDGRTMQPLQNFGVKLMSIGFLVEADQAVIWRGPMATQALDQLLRQTAWGELDLLLVDMPPGTGDIALTLAQRVPLSGAVLVTTPQEIALLDVVRGLRMFQKVNVPILGVVENMAVHHCEHCGHAEHVFGEGGGRRLAEAERVPYLGALPLARAIREQADGGRPTVVADAGGPLAALYLDAARRLGAQVARQALEHSHKFPAIRISKDT
jgi:ATP-binding protein involved in chromosome partitioning